ncbi:MAG TPA: ATP-binding cassette domain-containing protein, partial [Campylobacteraceae bacterium]|nr:ATP-binding cassette domain-containing protein [Campylobacteraceae bacterium]
MSKIIQAQSLQLAYNKNEPVIKNTDFSVEAKDFIFLTGKSGSGKSTFLKSLYGELPVSGGKLNVCGFDLESINGKKLNLLRKHIGVIF